MRANLLLATIKGPPPRGSVQEAVLQALLVKRDHAEYARTRALLQGIVNEKEAQSALEDYRNALFPYFEKLNSSDKKMFIDRLMSEVNSTVFRVTAIGGGTAKSKIRRIARQ